jgi:hypothetical protein
MFLRILDPETPGTRLGFDIFFTGEDGTRSTLSGEGEVAWSRNEYEGPGLPPGMGVRFLALAAGGAEVLTRVLGTGGLGLEGVSLETAFSDAPTLILDPSSPLSQGAGLDPGPAVDIGRGENSEGPREWTESEGPPVRSRSILRSLAPWLVLLGAILVGLVAWQRWNSARETAVGPSTLEGPPASTPEVLLDISAPGESVVVEGEGTPLGDPGGAALATAPSPLVAVSSSPPPPVRHVTEVRSEVGESLTMILLTGDGFFTSDQLAHSYIGGESPRIVLRVGGVERSGDQVNHTLDDGFIRAIRTGYHTGAAGEPGSLHVVLDVTSSEIKVLQVLPSGNELLIYLGPE